MTPPVRLLLGIMHDQGDHRGGYLYYTGLLKIGNPIFKIASVNFTRK